MNNLLGNITFRRQRAKSESPSHNESVLYQDTADMTSNSLPEISDDDNNDNTIMLKNIIEALELELKSAHSEIERLIIENCSLTKSNDELLKKNTLFKKITSSPVKHKAANLTPKSQKTQNEIVNAQPQTQHFKKFNETAIKLGWEKPEKPSRRICLLSSHKHNNILDIAENKLKNYKELCHYLMTNGNAKTLIKDLNIKIANFSMNDYCVILLGEEDFKTTRDYFEIIFYLRESLQTIKHTNIIICLPSYKYGKNTNMFNWRVENFNNLLYLDANTHEYAYIFDSNRNLKYDHSMFHRKYGTLNNFGVSVIFKNLQKYIEEIHYYKIYTETENKILPNEKENQDFFRDSISPNSTPKYCGTNQ